MSNPTVRLERNGRLVELILDAPERGNALNLDGADQLRSAARDIERDAADIGAVLIHATGKNFCVGGDLREFGSFGTEMGAHVRAVAEAAHEAIESLDRLTVPIVSAVQGAAAGAGIGLALSADIVFVAQSAKLRMAYTAIALSPDCGSTWLLTRRIGATRTIELGLTNRALTAAEALDWGIANRVAEDDALLDQARKVALDLANGPTDAYSATKALIKAANGSTLHDQLAAELDSIGRLASAAPAQDAVHAFLNR